jgi:thiamine pyrophosphate-dependent acetolactate synthase large subunit-like protein
MQGDPSDARSWGWGSDAIASYLRDLGFEYVALNPGASYRGLHDSLVNLLGNTAPRMLLCLHEEHAVAIAHGYAKVTGRPMLAALHTNVGLLHASMAIFNAWCDRVPVVVLGSNGPADAAQRRPWIDWLHTTADQAAPVRSFLKWDDEPRSVAAAAESLVRATALARQLPPGPTYVVFDAALQEQALPDGTAPRSVSELDVVDPVPDTVALDRLATALDGAERPVLILGRGARTQEAWDARVALAERAGARVVTDLRAGACFPTEHPLHAGPPGLRLSPPARAALAEADLVLALGPIDLAGALAQAGQAARGDRRVVSVTADPYVHNGWTKDHQALAVDATVLLGDPDRAVRHLVGRLPAALDPPAKAATETPAETAVETAPAAGGPSGDGIPVRVLASVVDACFRDLPTTFVRFPIGWPADLVRCRGPLDYLGNDGGAGVGSGPGLAVGVALALRDSERLAVAVLGDGDFLMGCTALWTAAAERLGLLVIVSNNRSYFNDELHQEHMARERGRPVENRWVGQRIDDPPVDVLAIARAQGAVVHGPVTDIDVLRHTLATAAEEARAGRLVVVDVAVRPEYDPGTPAADAGEAQRPGEESPEGAPAARESSSSRRLSTA